MYLYVCMYVCMYGIFADFIPPNSYLIFCFCEDKYLQYLKISICNISIFISNIHANLIFYVFVFVDAKWIL